MNALTFSNDEVNDVRNMKFQAFYPNNSVDIYNTYVEKVYSSIGYEIPWDGKYKGAELPTGTYYYITDPKNGLKVISGSITIIR